MLPFKPLPDRSEAAHLGAIAMASLSAQLATALGDDCDRYHGVPAYFGLPTTIMTPTIAECAENARQCRWYASKTNKVEERKFLLRMAKRWTELAAEKEREVREAARSAG